MDNKMDNKTISFDYVEDFNRISKNFGFIYKTTVMLKIEKTAINNYQNCSGLFDSIFHKELKHCKLENYQTSIHDENIYLLFYLFHRKRDYAICSRKACDHI